MTDSESVRHVDSLWAHTVQRIIFHLVARRESFGEPGVAYFAHQERQHARRRLAQLLKRLSCAVSLQPITSDSPPAA